MWLLECEGEVLGGKKLWLKPGNKYVMGRVPSPEVNLPMPSQKSISRVHLIIEVGNVPEGDGLKLHSRSTITVQDYKTKHGTRLDGSEIRNETKILDGEEHFFHLGKYEPGFRLFWKPIVLSISLSSKERKDKKVMSPYQKKVEALDIKTIGTFVSETTHVVATKRNTAAGLQALINGRYIVTTSYLDAIVEAASVSAGITGEEVRSPLETDFEGNWPNPEDYLPPYTNEPNDRESWRYRPNKKRKSLFEGCTFIVCERAQYDNFLGPITDAHGKLEKFDLEPGQTTAEDLVKFVRKREQSSQVVIVRFRGKKDPQWENQLSTEVQELHGFRMIEQNEFLDIIVMCKKDNLRVALREDVTPAVFLPVQKLPHASHASESSPLESTPAPVIAEDSAMVKATTHSKSVQQPAPHGRGRIRTRTKAFDPFAIDPSEFKPPPTQGFSDSTSQIVGFQDFSTSAPATGSLGQAAWGSEDSVNLSLAKQNNLPLSIAVEVDEERQYLPTQKSSAGLFVPQYPPPSSISRKRSMSPDEDRANEDFDIMDLLPGAQAVKRRKVAEQEERIQRGETITEESTPMSAAEFLSTKAAGGLAPKSKYKKVQKEKEVEVEVPYVIKAREIKEREEEQLRMEKEEELAAMDGLEVEKMKNLAIVEIMEVKPRVNKPVRGEYGDEGARWDDKWNGRKNFKKFRRQGRGGGMRTMRGSVMVNLVEHKGRDYGIGDGYWVDNDEGKESSARKKFQKLTPLLATEDSGLDRSNTPFRTARSQQSRSATQNQIQTQASSVESRSQVASVGTVRGTKRGAPATQVGRSGGVKKQKTLFLKNESGSEDESEDELKFRFKRK